MWLYCQSLAASNKSVGMAKHIRWTLLKESTHWMGAAVGAFSMECTDREEPYPPLPWQTKAHTECALQSVRSQRNAPTAGSHTRHCPWQRRAHNGWALQWVRSQRNAPTAGSHTRHCPWQRRTHTGWAL